MNTWGFELDQFAGFMFFMFIGGAGFGLVLGLLRFLMFTFIERNEA
jgi:NhaP-type Na+/H+ or K+/H+ antiporter